MNNQHPNDPLFEPFNLGDLTLPNRVLMSPLTRSRSSQPGDIPNDMNAHYYQQRAGAGMIFSEATQVSPQGKGYAFTPGIHSREQIDGWKKVTGAVHMAGGRIHMQLWHVGRISHPALQPDGGQPVAPSAIKPEGAKTFISADSGMVDVPEPRALETGEMADIVEQYRQGAKNAKEAGFDGVEVHAANGYLLDQFIKSGSNHRTDEYGGSVENRLRLPLMVIRAVIDVWGKDNVGVRVSPTGSFNAMYDADPVETFGTFARHLNELGIAYIEVVEDSFQGNHANGRPEEVIDAIRTAFKGTYIANGAYTAEEARTRISEGRCDLVTFGRPFIANPDLPERFRQHAPLNEWDDSTFYGGDEHGYTDYPTLKELEARA
ncbi:N-ethylmaleimide reductase [Marinobacter santoriniensis NKSG1]|uniref:N-ethylmaleimide reductase n=1 Tax=Marinobacter santoriniensis NKSG1 TaxID=1288826 RepID=M7D0N2_9GAMM|nr:alkene reductase [Marinobacter santoriniensis]EMP54313.1 N-ethylmaleimide reductase [Marinobacter santoriniensis NKSG1]